MTQFNHQNPVKKDFAADPTQSQSRTFVSTLEENARVGAQHYNGSVLQLRKVCTPFKPSTGWPV